MPGKGCSVRSLIDAVLLMEVKRVGKVGGVVHAMFDRLGSMGCMVWVGGL